MGTIQSARDKANRIPTRPQCPQFPQIAAGHSVKASPGRASFLHLSMNLTTVKDETLLSLLSRRKSPDRERPPSPFHRLLNSRDSNPHSADADPPIPPRTRLWRSPPSRFKTQYPRFFPIDHPEPFWYKTFHAQQSDRLENLRGARSGQ